MRRAGSSTTSTRTSPRTTTSPQTNRDKLIEMIGMWYVEAGKYNVLPIDSRGTLRLGEPRPQIAVERKSYHVLPGHADGADQRGRDALNRPHSITVDVEIPKGGAEGVLLSQGGNDGGFSFYVQDGKLHYAYNYVADTQYHVESKERRPGGTPQAALRVRADRQARHRQGQGRAGPRAALHRRQARRPDWISPKTIPLSSASAAASRPAPIPARR